MAKIFKNLTAKTCKIGKNSVSEALNGKIYLKFDRFFLDYRQNKDPFCVRG